MPDAKVLFSEWRKEPLFKQALRHRSAAGPDNERLEFIGDAVLDLLIAQRLYEAFPDSDEGDLTRMRAHLVRGENLAGLAREIRLGPMIQLGANEEANQGRDKASILAGVLEAVIGATYMLSGLKAADALVGKIFDKQLETVPPIGQLRDAKTHLQESLQNGGHKLPVYTSKRVSEKTGAPLFEAQCTVGDKRTSGLGGSIKKASQDAAEKMLALLEGA